MKIHVTAKRSGTKAVKVCVRARAAGRTTGEICVKISRDKLSTTRKAKVGPVRFELKCTWDLKKNRVCVVGKAKVKVRVLGRTVGSKTVGRGKACVKVG